MPKENIMIQSKILGEAAGIQYQGVKDESEINQSGGAHYWLFRWAF